MNNIKLYGDIGLILEVLTLKIGLGLKGRVDREKI